MSAIERVREPDMNTKHETEKPESIDLGDQGEDTSETRRRLLRAGLAAAPVLMAVKSRSVLACGGSYGGGNGVKCRVTCSAFASIKAATAAGVTLSHKPSTNYSCKSHIEWQGCSHPGQYSQKQNCYFHDKSAKPTRVSWGGCSSWNGDPQYSTNPYSYFKRSGCTYAGFASKSGAIQYGDKTLQEMLYCSDPLARHLVATILNKAGGYDTDNILPTQAQCLAIWNGNGVWTPPFQNATTWSRADTLAWFDLCYGTCS